MTTPMSTLFCLACTCLGSSVAFTSRLHPVKHTGMSSLLVQPPTHHYKYPLQPFLHHSKLSRSQSKISLSSSWSSGQLSSPFHDMDEIPEAFAFSYAGDAFSLESWDDGVIRPHPPPPTTTATATSTSTASTITTTTTTATLHHASTPTMTRPNKPRLYKHLYRHYDDISFDSWLRCSDPQAFLESIGYTPSEIQTLANALETKNFWKLDVHDHLAPKIRFVVETLGGGTGRLAWKPDGLVDSHTTMPPPPSMTMEECTFAVDDATTDINTEIPHTMRLYSPIKYLLPPTFFHPSLSMDRTLGPHHAYLAHSDLPHGKQLLDNPKLWQAFLMACQTNTFESLCQEWESYFFPADQPLLHTPERIQDFETAFAAGLIPACKGHHPRSTPTTTTIVDDTLVHHPHHHDHPPSSLHHHHANGEQENLDDHHDDDHNTDDDAATPNGLVTLLLSHGANAFETDRQGASPLHWAAGNGNLPTVQALLHSIALERQPPSLAPHPPTTPPPLHYFRHNNEEDVQQQQQQLSQSPSSNMVYDYDQGFDSEGSSHHDAIGNAPSIPIVLDILDEFREYKHGASPFHWACASVRSDYQDADFEGSYDVCQYLLQQAGERHVELANLPLSSGGTHPSTPIMWAAWAGNRPVVELLLVHGADPLQINPSTNQTVMHFAAASGHADICDLLLHSTKETYRMDDDPSILDKLLWNAVDLFGKAPLDYARDNGHANVIEWMMDKSLGSFLVKETAKGWFVPGSDDNSSSSSSTSSLHKNQPMNPKWSA